MTVPGGEPPTVVDWPPPRETMNDTLAWSLGGQGGKRGLEKGNSEDEKHYWGLGHIQVLMATFDTVPTDHGHEHESTNKRHA